MTSTASVAATIHESLPYIDVEPTAAERDMAQTLINAELDVGDHHPSLPTFAPMNFTPAVLNELARIEKAEQEREKQSLSAIDLSRYEAVEAPNDSDSDSSKHVDIVRWRAALKSAYTSQSYLLNRQRNLDLLQKYGKNAWVMGNAQLEDILRDVEKELETKKTEIDICVIERKSAQGAVSGEMKGLEETWKRGIGRVVETEMANEGLRKEILRKRREDIS